MKDIPAYRVVRSLSILGVEHKLETAEVLIALLPSF